MNREEFIERWSVLHGEPHLSKIVLGWLRISYQCARIATKFHLSPNFVTFLALFFAALATLNPISLWAALLILLSLLADGIDGSISIIQNRSSKWGSLIDSLGDRLSEVFWFYIIYKVGAPFWACILLWIFSGTAEYARARVAGLGISKIEIVTLTERPTRASITFIVLLASLLHIDAFVYLVYPYLILQVFSIYQIMKSAHRGLQEQQSQS